jgi:hypothetical protein
LQEESADTSGKIFADWTTAMAGRSPIPNFAQILESLRAHSFDVTPWPGAAGGVLVSKHGAAAVLVPAEGSPAAFAERPGVLIGGQVALLLDRGYQKFLKTSQYEFPATATQLHAIHLFSEELDRLTGATMLYNQALGTTSDVYRYDRLQGREARQAAPALPWSASDGH